jgi:hypothetical protein
MWNGRIPFSFTNCNWYSALLVYCIQYMLWYIKFSSYFRYILVQSQHLYNFWWTKCRSLTFRSCLETSETFSEHISYLHKVLSRLKKGLELGSTKWPFAGILFFSLKNAFRHWRSSFRNTDLLIFRCSYNNIVL